MMTMVRSVDGTSVWPDGGGYHAADGLFFTRSEDAGVLVRKYDRGIEEGKAPAFSLQLTPEAWASVVASMQASGDTVEAWQAALARQIRAG